MAPYFRYCKRCDKRFQPTTRRNNICPECKSKIWIERSKKMKLKMSNSILESLLKKNKKKR